jgi:DNA-binding NarL/FixJ family response regulator
LEQVVADVMAEVSADGSSSSARRADEVPATRLTRRESEVAELLERGIHHNRDIAAALTIAESTAGLHVQRILAKLGLHSRWEIGARSKRPGEHEMTKRPTSLSDPTT